MSDAKVTYYAVVGMNEMYFGANPLRELSATTMEAAMAEAATLEDPAKVETIHVLGVVWLGAVEIKGVQK